MNYTVERIASIVEGEIINSSNKDLVVRDLLFDSRLLVTPDNTLFFSLKSNRNDGCKYIDDLYEKGVRMFVVEKSDSISKIIENKDDAAFILVDDTLKSLQKTAASHRENFDIPIIGITGSNGKTVVKEWLYQILSPEISVVRSPKSYNSQIGVPMSVWQINDSHDIAIIEAGISRPDEMHNLKDIIKPTIGIFTNIGQAHGKNFDNIDDKIDEKLKLFSDVQTLIYCQDYKEIADKVKRLNINTFTWSRNDDAADVKICSIEKEKDNTTIEAFVKSQRTTVNGQQDSVKITIPFIDDASIENAIHCWTTALMLNMDNDVIARKMEYLSPVAMRMELKSGINNCDIIDDSYNSDFNALTIALDFMNQQHSHKERVVILSDILQSELREEELYDKIAKLLKNKGVNFVVGIGEAISRQKEKFKIRKEFYKDTKEFLSDYPVESFYFHILTDPIHPSIWNFLQSGH